MMITPPLPKIVVTQPVHAEVLTRLQAHGRVVMNPGPHPWTDDELMHHLADAEGMLAFMPDRVDRRLLQHAPRLRGVACALKGHDNFDLRACAEAGVSVSFVRDLLTEPTAELAIGLAIAAARHILPGDRAVRQGYGGWRPVFYGTGLHRSVVAVAGLGAVGGAIVDRLMGFGCAELLGVDPQARDARVEHVDLHTALRRADYLILAVPLVAQTRHLLDARALSHAKPGQIIVNIGRGSVVDEAAVAQALQDGRLGAYAADVYEMEDWLLPDRPAEVHPGLLNSPGTVLTPHIGSAVRRVRLAIEHRAADNLLQALRGECFSDLVTEADLVN
ncbi:D-glycerate dehydrogenase [Curvibacter fontanus]|jgi:phosphonate dehydrogenase|nr:NAD(P)-dependent oxidoreductase [Hylemonella sp.]